ncbi:SAM-dependent methyltransferase [Legionella norrlandica]|uniref:Release factor glutamine methyltransferase n=1 Tax=Legionella norrlandica TaxID=1498499 RepID=A0A0A2T6Q6_9GAMM|nr:peptide chain release factor N(5)-glutamine methyltransferase [Legionella norrlandica]KGP63113.1 SAM-dependent methyltransferase [Legionella norrlandica]
MISISSALEEALQQLKEKNPEARLEAEVLLCYVLHKSRAYLFAHPDALINHEQIDRYLQMIKQRSEGLPLAYITGQREFWSLPLKITTDVLIPRHETERLVELALELLPDKNHISVLDLGTGSGAIALALAKERPRWHIDACDFSKGALELARDNAKVLGIKNINFYHSNWFNEIPQKQYHAIVSNPPYIAEDDPHLKKGDLRFEPTSALVSSQDGLADLQYIIEHSCKYLLPNGLLLVEHGFEQKNAISSILKKLGYKNIHCWQDIQGHDRVSGGWRPDSMT